MKNTKPMPKKAQMMAAFKERCANPPKQINNSSLYAGSPMYFYCRYCGHLSDVLPETYINPPSHVCRECDNLKDLGWLQEAMS
jgi:hypothetical protein